MFSSNSINILSTNISKTLIFFDPSKEGIVLLNFHPKFNTLTGSIIKIKASMCLILNLC